jgi:AAA15 family ATPase/GTPase
VLLRFSIENFRSLRDRQVLSLVAGTGKEHSEALISIPGLPQRALRIAAIYGANASGKSNVLKALNFFAGAIRDSHRSWKPDGPVPVQPFALDGNMEKPITFAADFLVGRVQYEYGFSVNASKVLKEWLYAYPNQKKRVWFERDASLKGGIRFGKHLLGENRAIENITRINSLFLSAAAQNNHEMLLPIFTWLTTKIEFSIGPRSAISPEIAERCGDPRLTQTLSRLLAAADLGIMGLDCARASVDEEIRTTTQDFLKKLATKFALATNTEIPSEVHTVQFRHRSKGETGIALANDSESAGTLAFLSLLCPALEVANSGGVLCVDELDSSLHPLLALEIVRLFNDPQRNPRGAQLIFNTHDVNLLDSSVLRRDEVWLTEKDSEGSTHLYSLNDFKPRKQENLKRGYLQGRYGAVPFVGALEFHNLDDVKKRG